MNNQEQFQHTLCDRLLWHTAERDDAKVADYLFHHKEMNMVYAMDEATLFLWVSRIFTLNRNKLIVFVGESFGIFPSHEVFMPADVPVRNIAKELNISRKQILDKYTETVTTKNL